MTARFDGVVRDAQREVLDALSDVLPAERPRLLALRVLGMPARWRVRSASVVGVSIVLEGPVVLDGRCTVGDLGLLLPVLRAEGSARLEAAQREGDALVLVFESGSGSLRQAALMRLSGLVSGS
jgi:hypothetical protein